MNNKEHEFEEKLKAYLRANPDVARAAAENDIGLLRISGEWEREAERGGTPEKKTLARGIARRAIHAYRARRRRAARALAVSCACLFIFFAFVPQGQTLAKGAVETVADILDDKVRFETEGSESELRSIPNLPYREFKDIGEAAKYARQRIIYIDDPSLKIESVTVSAEGGIGIMMSTTYIQPDGRKVVVYQDIAGSRVSVGVDIYTGESYFGKRLFNGETMYCVNHDDGTYSGTAFWDNNSLGIMSENVPWDIMVKYIDHFAITDIA